MRDVNGTDPVVERARAEYREMPGLRLTIAQACRLWHIERAICEAVMEQLVRDEIVRQASDGAYVALGSSQLTSARKLWRTE